MIYWDLSSEDRTDGIVTNFTIPFSDQVTIIGKKSEKFKLTLVQFVITFTNAILSEPRLYLKVYTSSFQGDKSSIFFSNEQLTDYRFILQFDKLQADITATPLWITYKSSMEQQIRFIGNSEITVQVADSSGNILPDIPRGNVFVTFGLEEKEEKK